MIMVTNYQYIWDQKLAAYWQEVAFFYFQTYPGFQTCRYKRLYDKWPGLAAQCPQNQALQLFTWMLVHLNKSAWSHWQNQLLRIQQLLGIQAPEHWIRDYDRSRYPLPGTRKRPTEPYPPMESCPYDMPLNQIPLPKNVSWKLGNRDNLLACREAWMNSPDFLSSDAAWKLACHFVGLLPKYRFEVAAFHSQRLYEIASICFWEWIWDYIPLNQEQKDSLREVRNICEQEADAWLMHHREKDIVAMQLERERIKVPWTKAQISRILTAWEKFIYASHDRAMDDDPAEDMAIVRELYEQHMPEIAEVLVSERLNIPIPNKAKAVNNGRAVRNMIRDPHEYLPAPIALYKCDDGNRVQEAFNVLNSLQWFLYARLYRSWRPRKSLRSLAELSLKSGPTSSTSDMRVPSLSCES